MKINRDFELDERAKERLERLVQNRRKDRSKAFRASVILCIAAHPGEDNVQIGNRLRSCRQTIAKWRKRYLENGIDGLRDRPRPGIPRKISDSQVEQIIVKTLETKPKNATHWSTRSMAANMGLSQSSIGRVWRAFGLKPHRASSFSISNDPEFFEKIQDVVGLYMSPPANAVVLSVDEKSQIQALNRTQPILPMRPGCEERRTPDYDRHGTTTLFAALDVKTGKILGKCYARHRAIEFRKFLNEIYQNTPANLDLHIILDNYATHKSPPIKRWLLQHPRVHLHFIPTHSSWLNMIERWFALLTDRQIKRGSHTSVSQLKMAIDSYITETNETPKPFTWTKTADQILESIAKYAGKTLEAHAKTR